MNPSQKKITAVLGVDIFVAAHFSNELPYEAGGLKLSGTYSRGTLITETSSKTMLDVGWLSARYLFETKKPDSAEIDLSVTKLISEIGKKYRWTSLIKLVELDGTKAFS
jgi:hypothetical protein